MNWLVVSLFLNLILVVVAVVLAWRLWCTREAGDSQQIEEIERLSDRSRVERRFVIVMDILNPLELVAKRSWIGAKFSNLSPALIQRIVVKQTRDQLRAGMQENGVDADIRVIQLGRRGS